MGFQVSCRTALVLTEFMPGAVLACKVRSCLKKKITLPKMPEHLVQLSSEVESIRSMIAYVDALRKAAVSILEEKRAKFFADVMEALTECIAASLLEDAAAAAKSLLDAAFETLDIAEPQKQEQQL